MCIEVHQQTINEKLVVCRVLDQENPAHGRVSRISPDVVMPETLELNCRIVSDACYCNLTVEVPHDKNIRKLIVIIKQESRPTFDDYPNSTFQLWRVPGAEPADDSDLCGTITANTPALLPLDRLSDLISAPLDHRNLHFVVKVEGCSGERTSIICLAKY